MLAHVPKLHDFVEGMRIPPKPGGVITMEFPHLLQLMRHVQFDTIYHEHFSYFSLLAVEKCSLPTASAFFDVIQFADTAARCIFAAHDGDASHPYSVLSRRCGRRIPPPGSTHWRPIRISPSAWKLAKRHLLRFLVEARSWEDGGWLRCACQRRRC